MSVDIETLRLRVAHDLSLHARRWPGDRTPFLLVHGLASNARMWDGVGGALAASGHDVVVPDLRGHGRSDKPDDGYAIADVADDLAAVIDLLGWSGVVAVGQSWGGNVVVELAARRPELLAGVVGIDGGTLELSGRFPDWEACAAALAPPPTVGMTPREVEDMFRRRHRDWPEASILGALANWEVREDGTVAPWLTRDRHFAVLRGLWDHRPSTRFAAIAVPVLLLPVETDSQWELEKQADVAAAAAAGSTVRVHWLRGDHDVHAQHPELVAAMLHDFAEAGGGTEAGWG